MNVSLAETQISIGGVKGEKGERRGGEKETAAAWDRTRKNNVKLTKECCYCAEN